MLIRFKRAAGLYRAGEVAGFSGKREGFAKECVRLGAAIEVEPVLDGEGNPTRQVRPVAGGTADAAAAAEETVDYSSKSKDELVQLAEKRELEVVRGDGQDGEPVKADYVRALQEADEAVESADDDGDESE